jgi:hypothetical protein
MGTTALRSCNRSWREVLFCTASTPFIMFHTPQVCYFDTTLNSAYLRPAALGSYRSRFAALPARSTPGHGVGRANRLGALVQALDRLQPRAVRRVRTGAGRARRRRANCTSRTTQRAVASTAAAARTGAARRNQREQQQPMGLSTHKSRPPDVFCEFTGFWKRRIAQSVFLVRLHFSPSTSGQEPKNGISMFFVEIPLQWKWKLSGNQGADRDHDRISSFVILRYKTRYVTSYPAPSYPAKCMHTASAPHLFTRTSELSSYDSSPVGPRKRARRATCIKESLRPLSGGGGDGGWKYWQ